MNSAREHAVRIDAAKTVADVRAWARNDGNDYPLGWTLARIHRKDELFPMLLAAEALDILQQEIDSGKLQPAPPTE